MIVAKQNGEATLTKPTLEQTLLSRTELNANLHASRIQSTQVLFPFCAQFFPQLVASTQPTPPSARYRLNCLSTPLHRVSKISARLKICGSSIANGFWFSDQAFYREAIRVSRSIDACRLVCLLLLLLSQQLPVLVVSRVLPRGCTTSRSSTSHDSIIPKEGNRGLLPPSNDSIFEFT